MQFLYSGRGASCGMLNIDLTPLLEGAVDTDDLTKFLTVHTRFVQLRLLFLTDVTPAIKLHPATLWHKQARLLHHFSCFTIFLHFGYMKVKHGKRYNN